MSVKEILENAGRHLGELAKHAGHAGRHLGELAKRAEEATAGESGAIVRGVAEGAKKVGEVAEKVVKKA